MPYDELTPAATQENTELLRALLSNVVLMREALERIDTRVDKICREVLAYL